MRSFLLILLVRRAASVAPPNQIFSPCFSPLFDVYTEFGTLPTKKSPFDLHLSGQKCVILHSSTIIRINPQGTHYRIRQWVPFLLSGIIFQVLCFSPSTLLTKLHCVDCFSRCNHANTECFFSTNKKQRQLFSASSVSCPFTGLMLQLRQYKAP